MWLPEYLEKFQADPLRYTLARNAPETRDMNFTWEGFQARNNNELGNNFGNLINRVFTFIHKYFDGKVPEWSEEMMTDLDRQAVAEVEADLEKWVAHMEKFEIKAALETCFPRRPGRQPLLRRVGSVQDPQDRHGALRPEPGRHHPDPAHAGLMLAPVVPFAMEKLWGWLGMESDLWRGGWDRRSPGHSPGAPPGPAGNPVPAPGRRPHPARDRPPEKNAGRLISWRGRSVLAPELDLVTRLEDVAGVIQFHVRAVLLETRACRRLESLTSRSANPASLR